MSSIRPVWVHGDLSRHGGLQLVTRFAESKPALKGVIMEGIHDHLQQNGMERTSGSDSSNRCTRDDITLVTLLKACAKEKDLYEGNRLHADIVERGLLKKNLYIGNTLVYMFSKCGALAKAQDVFNELPVRDAVSWTSMITAYTQYAHSKEALDCFEQMQQEGSTPDAMTLASVLKACGSIGALERGKAIHSEIVPNSVLENDTVLGNALVDMYAKCDALTNAQQVFDELPRRDIISWNSLITGYCQCGHGEEALTCLEQMKCEGFSPDEVTFTCILQACGCVVAEERGKEIHAEIIRKKMLRNGTLLGNALVDMYAKCGALVKAHQVFDNLPARDLVSWGTLIAGYSQHGHGEKALNCFQRLKGEGLSPDAAILACILKSCGSIGVAERGQEIHAEIVKTGLLGSSDVLGSALVDMYAKFGALAKAQQVFDGIRVRNIVLWNALITGYCQNGRGEEALKCFKSMNMEGFFPDVVTLACILKACGCIGANRKGEEFHAEILKKGLLGSSTVLGNALVDMYARCGALTRAQEVFNELPNRNLVSWNALMTGYCQHGDGDEALKHYEWLKHEGLSPDTITYVCVLKACGSIGAAGKGKEIHAEIARMELHRSSMMLGNALVDMYGKCGVLAEAQQVFAELLVRDVVSWNALIAGYCEYGCCKEALKCLEQMKGNGVRPDEVTFTSILKACSSVGAAEKGHTYLEEMSSSYGINPTFEHYTCMVDLFSRAGDMDKAMAVIKKMPCSEYFPVWCSLLGACLKWANVKLGELAFKHAVRLEENSALPYVLMSSIYAGAGMHDDAESIEALLMENGAWKKPEHYWWTETSKDVLPPFVKQLEPSTFKKKGLKSKPFVIPL